MKNRLRYEDYTVAWIAPLAIEAEAALLALDRRHDGSFASKRGDDYIYIGGEINGHNVVVATLPTGQSYGVGAAAALVNQVKIRFESIRFALLVGVAAGLPNLSPAVKAHYRDIALGDVLVAVPDQLSSGIIHYDLGRDIEGHDFSIVGRQAEPPTIVRSAIAHIQLTKKNPFREGNEFANHLKDLQAQDEYDQFKCPPQEQDQLRSVPLDDQHKRVRREDTERTKVWYGTIGSGNSLMRNAQRRDELRDKYNLIGLEMEAAGVMNSVPTAVIRGVCDYADGYKTKVWQPYAAAVAAVYAKGILNTIQPDASAVNSDAAPTPSIVIPFTRDPDFVEREILGQVKQLFVSGVNRVALVGMGGVGKSQLAIEHCYQTRDMSSSTWVFWVHASNATRFEQGYRAIASVMKIPQHDDPKADILSVVYNWLCQETHGEWLMVIDNADNLKDFYPVQDTSESLAHSTQGPLLAQYLPQCSHGAILVTTRSKEVALRLTGRNSSAISVPCMAEDTALTLLKKKLEPSLYDHSHALQLIKHLECIPLAISQAAAYINHHSPRSSIKQYNELLERSDRSKSNVLNYEEGDLRRNPEAANSVITTWQLSFDQLQNTQTSAAQLLCLMSFFHHQDIPERLLAPNLDLSTLSINDEGIELDTAESSDDEEDQRHVEGQENSNWDLERDTQKLLDYHLINLKGDGESFEMHALVQLATRRWLQLRGAFQSEHTRFIKALHREFPTSGVYENWAECQKLLVHVETALAQKPANQASLLQWADILYRAAWYLQTKGDYGGSEKMVRKVVKIRKKVLGEEHPETLVGLSLLGSVLEDLCQYLEAEEIHRSTVLAQKETLGPENTWTLTSMVKLANVLTSQGKYNEAEEMHRAVLIVRQKVLSPENREVITAMTNLGLALRLLERYQEAEEMTRTALAAQEKLLGPEHPETSIIMDNLASTLAGQGRQAEAETLHRKNLAIRQKVLGSTHPRTVRNLNNVACAVGMQGRYHEAEVLFRMTLSLYKDQGVLPIEHEDTLMTMNNLSHVLSYLGQYAEAEQLQRETLEIRKRVLGTQHPDTAQSMMNLGYALEHLGSFEEAIQIYKEAVAIIQANLGPDHPLASKFQQQLNRLVAASN